VRKNVACHSSEFDSSQCTWLVLRQITNFVAQIEVPSTGSTLMTIEYTTPTKFFVNIPANRKLTLSVDYETNVKIYGREGREPTTSLYDYQTARPDSTSFFATATLPPSVNDRKVNFIASGVSSTIYINLNLIVYLL
jgi:hypothetical protein